MSKNCFEINFPAGESISEGQVVYFDASTQTVKKVSAATQHPIGVAAQTVDAGYGCAIHSFETGHGFHVAVSETVTAGAKLGISATGAVVLDDGTADERGLPLIAVEAKTVSSGTELVHCICADVRAVNA